MPNQAPEGRRLEELAIAKLQRIGNIVANLAHPKSDHRDNPLEDEAHDLLRELRTELGEARAAAFAECAALVAKWRNRTNFADPEATEDALAYWNGIKRCADELERAIEAAASPAPQEGK